MSTNSRQASNNCQMGIPDFQNLREVLSGLSLHEVDFAVGDAVVSRIGDVKQAISKIDANAEPWVREWLSAEHVKAGMLWAAAKTNWSREQSNGADGTFNRGTRAVIIDRFNQWVLTIQDRLDVYERSSRSPDDVEKWRNELERFKQDPLGNP